MKIIAFITFCILCYSCSDKKCENLQSFLNLNINSVIDLEVYNSPKTENTLHNLLNSYSKFGKIELTELIKYSICLTEPKEWMGTTSDASIIVKLKGINESYGIWFHNQESIIFDSKTQEYFVIQSF